MKKLISTIAAFCVPFLYVSLVFSQPPTSFQPWMINNQGQGNVGQITGPNIASGTITGANVATGAVGSTQLATNTIQANPVVTLTDAQIRGMNATPVLAIAPAGPGTVIEVVSVVYNWLYTAAFGGGGTVNLAYGASGNSTASGTIAASVLTSLSQNEIVSAAGAIGATGSTGVINTGVYITNGSAGFTGGTGSTGLVHITYRVHSGIQ